MILLVQCLTTLWNYMNTKCNVAPLCQMLVRLYASEVQEKLALDHLSRQ